MRTWPNPVWLVAVRWGNIKGLVLCAHTEERKQKYNELKVKASLETKPEEHCLGFGLGAPGAMRTASAFCCEIHSTNGSSCGQDHMAKLANPGSRRGTQKVEKSSWLKGAGLSLWKSEPELCVTPVLPTSHSSPWGKIGAFSNFLIQTTGLRQKLDENQDSLWTSTASPSSSFAALAQRPLRTGYFGPFILQTRQEDINSMGLSLWLTFSNQDKIFYTAFGTDRFQNAIACIFEFNKILKY